MLTSSASTKKPFATGRSLDKCRLTSLRSVCWIYSSKMSRRSQTSLRIKRCTGGSGRQSIVGGSTSYERIGDLKVSKRNDACSTTLRISLYEKCTAASVVSRVIATDAAFCRDTRVTFAGSITPNSNISLIRSVRLHHA